MIVLTNEYLNYNPPLPPVLYHYCSTQAFLSIIQNRSIWLSDADKTNDKMELRFIFKEIKKVIDVAINSYSSQYDDEILCYVKETSFKIIENLFNKTAPIVSNGKFFLTCFSEDGDLLSQWRAYANNGKGIAIGFNSNLFAGFANSTSYGFTKIIYNENILCEFLQKAINEPLKWAMDSCIDETTREYDKDDLIFQIAILIQGIWQEGFVYKHGSFSEEREWRIFRRAQSSNFNDDDGVDDYGYADFLEGLFINNEKYLGNFSRSQLKYRYTDNDIRLYYDLCFEKCKKDIIKEIILGPKCEIAELDLKLLLAQNKYIEDVWTDSIKIIKSESPYV